MTATSIPPATDDLLSIATTGSPSAVTLVVAGEVDSSSAPALDAEVTSSLAARPAELAVDLRSVTFLDSAGLCVLAGAHRRATEQGIRLRILASGRAVVRPLQITGLWDLLAVEQAE